MAIVAPHNLRRPDAGIQRPFGVRITLKLGDPFRKLLGADWNKTHWYGTALERDAALITRVQRLHRLQGRIPHIEHRRAELTVISGQRVRRRDTGQCLRQRRVRFTLCQHVVTAGR